jgi:hypothetical protein
MTFGPVPPWNGSIFDKVVFVILVMLGVFIAHGLISPAKKDLTPRNKKER